MLTTRPCAADEPRYGRDRSASPRDDQVVSRPRSRSPNGRFDDRYASAPFASVEVCSRQLTRRH